MAAISINQGKHAKGSPAGALKLPRPAFSYYEIYARVEGIEASHQRLFRHGNQLVGAVQKSLANSSFLGSLHSQEPVS